MTNGSAWAANSKMGRAELRGLPMWEGDKIFLRLLEENVPFFSLKLQYQGDRLDRAVLNGRRIV